MSFFAQSQRKTFAWLERHALRVVPGYGHLDIFLGRNAARDVFPGMVAELSAPA